MYFSQFECLINIIVYESIFVLSVDLFKNYNELKINL